MPVQTVTYPYNPPSSPYTPVYGDRDRFMEAGRQLRDLPSNPSLRNHESQETNQPQVEDSSNTDNSANSSPENTPSLMSVPSLSDTPGPSPDTPASIQSLSYRSFAPPKKARNLKNLAVNTTSSMPYGRAFSTAALPEKPRHDLSIIPGPATASFIKPSAPSRRLSSKLGLTLMTPPLDARMSTNEEFGVPPTPSLIRPVALRRFQSSPLLPLNVPRSAGLPPTPIDISRMSLSVVPSELDENEQQRFDIPQSREEKPEAYPDGPICIYEPNVWLYFEPTAEEAAGYDVVMNVASEVLNPFSTDVDRAVDVNEDQPPLSIVTVPSTNTKPEYIHIPWEHNTDIVPDLYRLVQLIDNRAQQGKRVLIHCQCGVSRSASLIVAYGLYKNPSITVQQAYDTVKRRSKWIGPNMSLIMQLQEFRTKLIQGTDGAVTIQRARSKTSQGRIMTSSLLGTEGMPLSAPLQQKGVPSAINVDGGVAVTPGPSSAPSNMTWSESKPAVTEQQLSSLGTPVVTAAGQMLQRVIDVPQAEIRTAELTLKGLQFPQIPGETLLSPRSTEFAMASIHAPAIDHTFGLTSPRFDAFPSTLFSLADHTDVKPTTKERPLVAHLPLAQHTSISLDEIMSPRVSEFTINPFHTPLAVPSAPSPVKGATEDPRSPPPKGSTPIVRNIFDVL